MAATVLVDADALGSFLAAAAEVYRRLTPSAPLPCFAVAVGSAGEQCFRVARFAFGRNVRATDPDARREFAETIVPRFGPAYRNELRGWWLDPRDLLRIGRAADDDGLTVLGSIHMHPDWHRIA